MAEFGFVWDERCLAHRNGVGAYPDGGAPPWLPLIAFERPERMGAVVTALAGSGVLAQLRRLPARAADEADLLLAHTPAHVEHVRGAARAPRSTCPCPTAAVTTPTSRCSTRWWCRRCGASGRS